MLMAMGGGVHQRTHGGPMGGGRGGSGGICYPFITSPIFDGGGARVGSGGGGMKGGGERRGHRLHLPPLRGGTLSAAVEIWLQGLIKQLLTECLRKWLKTSLNKWEWVHSNSPYPLRGQEGLGRINIPKPGFAGGNETINYSPSQRQTRSRSYAYDSRSHIWTELLWLQSRF
nr:hypothetical protein [Morchella crassipes]